MNMEHVWLQYMCEQYRTPSPMMVYGMKDKRLCIQIFL
jgi:hypothetical protein